MSEKQETLTRYIKCEKPIIFADYRELGCNVTELLRRKGAEVRETKLEVGDYLISGKVVIERKTAADFLNSLVDGRLFEQLRNMLSYEKPLLLIEGTPRELFVIRNINSNALIGALASITLDLGIPILFSDSDAQTADILYIIAKRIQIPNGKEVALHKKRRLALHEQQQFIVESLPYVGPKLAKALLKRFGTVKAVFNASRKELEEIEKIGPKKAKKIIEVLEAKYNREGAKGKQ